ncbi:hypothetical protein [Haliangium sp.]|uniref:hypothetical protein n=1 Tax=Haliangium sp. TaxID=2663208 RepID=UPI003D137FEA
MDDPRLAYVLAAVLAATVALELGLRALARGWRRLLARRRQRRAVRGERRAERLLERQGYRVRERQAEISWTLDCDGEPYEVPLRADLVVERRGRRYVAEVKTGRVAPRLSTASTRRQLLEYRIAYDVDGVLLVDVEAGRVIEVTFPLPAKRAGPRWRTVLWALLLGAAAGLVAAQWL